MERKKFIWRSVFLYDIWIMLTSIITVPNPSSFFFFLILLLENVELFFFNYLVPQIAILSFHFTKHLISIVFFFFFASSFKYYYFLLFLSQLNLFVSPSLTSEDFEELANPKTQPLPLPPTTHIHLHCPY